MARPPVITEDVKKAIAKIKNRHPSYSIRDIQKQLPILESSLAGKVPGKTAISDYLREILNPNETNIKKSGIDELWSLGVAFNSKYAVSPESIPHILEVQRIAANPVTIRRARWIDYLSRVINKDTDKLKNISFGYAYAELIANLSGQQNFDTTEYDLLLRESKFNELEALLWGRMSDDDALALLSAGEAHPIKSVRFDKNKAIGIAKIEILLGSKFVWFGVLQRRGEIDHYPKNGEVVDLKNPFLPNKKQLANIIKDGNPNE